MNLLFLDLPDYSKITFPPTEAVPLESLIPDATEDAKALFKVQNLVCLKFTYHKEPSFQRFIIYDSAKRVKAKDALLDPYFYNDPLPAK